MSDEDAAVAYTYAWWLTGDGPAALAAVRRAAATPAVSEAAAGRRLEVLLREVRAVAAPTPTMCPASEVALLHDVHGLALEQAAELVAVDAADARTELAHGRLEALVETVIDPFAHPERLGGLAVANPADVAHARQCDSCGQAREMLERGRAELRVLTAPPAPDDVAETALPPATDRDGRAAPAVSSRRLVALTVVAVVLLAAVLLAASRVTGM